MAFEEGNTLTPCGSNENAHGTTTKCHSYVVPVVMLASGIVLGVLLGSLVTWAYLRPKSKQRAKNTIEHKRFDDDVELVPNDGQLSEFSFNNVFQPSKTSVTTSDVGNFSNNNDDITVLSNKDLSNKTNLNIKIPQSNIVLDSSYSVSTFGTHQDHSVTAVRTMNKNAQTKRHNAFVRKRSFDGFFPSFKNIKAEMSPKKNLFLKKNVPRQDNEKEDISYIADEHSFREFVVDSNPMAGDISIIYTFSDITSANNQGSCQVPYTPKNDPDVRKHGNNSDQPLTPATVSSDF